MDLLQAIILGIIQGLTEWLPISSTGHLRIAEYLMGMEIPIVFDGLLHIGTIIVTLVFFRKEIKNLLMAIWRRDFGTETGRLVPLIIVGTIPTLVIGLVFGDIIESFFRGYLPIAGAFAICGAVLYVSRFGKESSNSPSFLDALVIGAAQGLAIVPGLSRSGLTIASGLLLGLKRGKAFSFSFLLSVPAILGAVGLTFYNDYDELVGSGIGSIEILMGVALAMIVGYFALKLLRRILEIKKFYGFAFYCWFMALALVILGLVGF